MICALRAFLIGGIGRGNARLALAQEHLARRIRAVTRGRPVAHVMRMRTGPGTRRRKHVVLIGMGRETRAGRALSRLILVRMIVVVRCAIARSTAAPFETIRLLIR